MQTIGIILGQATDMAGVITEVSDYKDTAIVVGIYILIFLMGRYVVRACVR